jgi:hypothetical protein
MRHLTLSKLYSIMIIVVMGLLCLWTANAQERMSDKDVETQMNNLREDSKKFRSSFNSAVGKSTVRKTSREKDAKALVERFGKDCEGMLNQFKCSKKAVTTLLSVLSAADQIDKFMADVPLDDRTNADWSRVKAELGTLRKAFPSTS